MIVFVNYYFYDHDYEFYYYDNKYLNFMVECLYSCYFYFYYYFMIIPIFTLSLIFPHLIIMSLNN